MLDMNIKMLALYKKCSNRSPPRKINGSDETSRSLPVSFRASMPTLASILVLLLCIFALDTGLLRAATLTFTAGGNDNDWFNPANWDAGRVPTALGTAPSMLSTRSHVVCLLRAAAISHLSPQIKFS